MSHIIVVASVILYCFVIYWFLRNRSGVNSRSLFVCFVLGVVSAALSLGLEYLWDHLFGLFIASHPSLIFVESFIGVSLIEEGAKWLCLVIIIYRWPSFDMYTDGILYACGVAAGFNMVEGLLYASLDYNPLNMLLRTFTAVPAHFLFAIVMGFLFARYKLEGDRFFWFSILFPVVLHGLYDFFILQQYADLLMGAAILVLLGSLALSIWICGIAVKADRLRIIKTL